MSRLRYNLKYNIVRIRDGLKSKKGHDVLVPMNLKRVYIHTHDKMVIVELGTLKKGVVWVGLGGAIRNTARLVKMSSLWVR